MSMSSWYVIVTKLVDQTKLLAQAEQVQKEFWGAASVRKGADLLKEHSPFRFIAEKGLESVAAHHGMLENVDLNTWVTMSIHRSTAIVQGRMQDGLALLATVGSTAPFVGLFGTVWGIYHALVKIGMSGQASIDKVAGPVGESLIMTAIGLAVAVPAVLGYNWLVRRNKSVMEAVNTFGYGLHALLLVAPKN
jgi:biopolymer transport protein ExbB